MDDRAQLADWLKGTVPPRAGTSRRARPTVKVTRPPLWDAEARRQALYDRVLRGRKP